MTPDQQAQFAAMYADFVARQTQQLRYPVDDASKSALGAVTYAGTSAHSTTTSIGAVPATVAAIPTGFFVIDVQGVQYTIPYYT